MAKKKFTEGLESLFMDTAEPQQMGGGKTVSDKRKNSSAESNSSNSKFTADLQSFLTEAFEDAFEEQLSTTGKNPKKKKSKGGALSGLDILIRNTTDPKQQIEIEEHAPRRITLTLDDQHLIKLREIAKKRKTYLKEMIKEIVADYLQQH